MLNIKKHKDILIFRFTVCNKRTKCSRALWHHREPMSMLQNRSRMTLLYHTSYSSYGCTRDLALTVITRNITFIAICHLQSLSLYQYNVFEKLTTRNAPYMTTYLVIINVYFTLSILFEWNITSHHIVNCWEMTEILKCFLTARTGVASTPRIF